MRSKFVFLFLTCCFILTPVFLWAQEGITVSGKVTDNNGDPLPGANVLIQLTNLGTAADINGEYKFMVPAKAVKGQEVKLEARFIGYRTRVEKVVLTPGVDVNQDFTLPVDILDMDAIVVTGVMEETPKTKLAFTVSRVNEEQIQMAPSVNPMSSLKGKVAGAKVVQGEGTPGTGVSINLRGATSIQKTSTPLIVVDGTILGANQIDLDALDIESMEVVKGAAAASIWGARAANGIIQIKTKRGSGLALDKTRITLRSEVGVNQLPAKSQDYVSQHHEFKVNASGQFVDDDGNVVEFGDAVLDDDAGFTFQDNVFPGQLYDHMGLFFDPGTFNRNSASVSHNSGTTNYRISFGNIKEPGVVTGQKGYRRNNLRLNFDHRINSNFDLSFTGYYSSSTRDDPQTEAPNPLYGLMFINPNANLLENNEDGTPYKVQPDPRTLEENPLYAINNAEISADRQRIQGSLSLRYSPWSWLNIAGDFSFDRSDRLRQEFYFKGFKTIDGGKNLGEFEKSESHDEAINASITATITKQFGDLTSRTQLRYLLEDTEFSQTFAQGQDLTVNDVRDLGVVQGDKSINSAFQEVRSAGYYLVSGIDYRDKYIADILVRRDGSSLFGPEERWNTYFRFSGAYRLSQEPWWFTDKINEFKLRYSVGTAGGRPSFADQYEVFSVSGGSVTKGNLGNKELKPEFATEHEFGMEMTFLDRFGLELVYARTTVKDQLLEVPLAGYYGFSEQWQNAGTVENNTIEASLHASLLTSRNMSWSAGLVFDRTHQKITEFNLPAFRYGPQSAFYNRKGEVLGSMYGKLWMTSKDELAIHDEGIHANSMDQFDVNDDGLLVPVGSGNSYKSGLWGTTVTIDGVDYDWGMPLEFVDFDENGNKTTFHKIGDVVPDFNLGLSSTFRWKGFNAYVLFDAEVGGEIYNNTRQWAYRELRHKDVDQFGKADELKKPINYYAALYAVNAINSWYVEDGTYVKLRELNLSYAFNQTQLSSIFGSFIGNSLNRISIGVIGRNLLTFTDYSGFDPEVGEDNATQIRFDGFDYPNYRTFTGYIEVEF
ncbi:MAG: SusC/RagA family TonB-linked outer membrane protein [bacterium]